MLKSLFRAVSKKILKENQDERNDSRKNQKGFQRRESTLSIGNWEPKKRNTPYKPNDRFQQRRIYEDNNRLRSENEELRQRLNYLEARLQGELRWNFNNDPRTHWWRIILRHNVPWD